MRDSIECVKKTMKFIISIFIITACLTKITYAKLEAPQCCDSEKNFLIESQCDADKEGKIPQIKLECEEKYILDPFEFEEDNYTITENGTLLIADMQTVLFRDE